MSIILAHTIIMSTAGANDISYSLHDYLPISMHIFLGLFSNVAFCIVNRGKWLGRLERIIKEANKQATVFVGRPLTRTAHLLFYVD